MPKIRADLHLHTVLSACGDLEMSPLKIVAQAKSVGLDLIAVTDHNSAENVRAVIKAGAAVGLKVLPGLEVTTSEEIHIVCLFDRPKGADMLQEFVYDRLPPGENDTDYFGFQVVCDEHDEIVSLNPRLLSQSTRVTMAELIEVVRGMGGVAIAAHIDRPSFSIISQLGFVPEGLDLLACELSPHGHAAKMRQLFPKLACPLIHSSDAHFIEDIGRTSTILEVEDFSLGAISRAIQGLV